MVICEDRWRSREIECSVLLKRDMFSWVLLLRSSTNWMLQECWITRGDEFTRIYNTFFFACISHLSSFTRRVLQSKGCYLNEVCPECLRLSLKAWMSLTYRYSRLHLPQIIRWLVGNCNIWHASYPARLSKYLLIDESQNISWAGFIEHLLLGASRVIPISPLQIVVACSTSVVCSTDKL